MGEPTDGTGAPRSQHDLVAGCILPLLAEHRSHGYELQERMQELMPLWAVSPGNVYRELRRMDSERLVASGWEASETRGPARRVYEITGSGRAALDDWASEVVEMIEVLDGCIRRHTGPCRPRRWAGKVPRRVGIGTLSSPDSGFRMNTARNRPRVADASPRSGTSIWPSPEGQRRHNLVVGITGFNLLHAVPGQVWALPGLHRQTER